MRTDLNVTKSDFLVKDLDKVQAAYAQFQGKMFAGRINADNGDRTGDTMFWMFEPDTQEVPDSLVIWLNGGPGCSSFNCGVMMEHSPVTQPLKPAGYCCLKPSPELDYNEHAWTRATTMLYIEHPWGTGFSYGRPEPLTEFEASGDLYAFLQNFFYIFDHLASRELFIFGESYAGMFVPSIMHYFHHKNQDLKKELKHGGKSKNGDIIINLAGGAMGNGWIDPSVQGPATIDYSWWHGLIDKPTRDALMDTWNHCAKGEMKDVSAPFHPFTVQDDCGMMWGILAASGHPNEYDITTFDANVDQVTFTSEAFYNTPAVKTALNAPEDHFWHGCQWGEGRRRQLMEQTRRLYMDNDVPITMAPYLAELLDAGLPLLIYNGDRDMTTNMVGTELVLNGLEWHGKEAWLDAPRGLWKTNNYPSGWAKEHDGLTFAVVYNSGHMVPYNQPEAAYDLVLRFLQKKTMIDQELPQIRTKHKITPETMPWIHTGEHKHASVAGPEMEMVSSASTEMPVIGNGAEHTPYMALSFLAGVLACFVGLRLANRGRRDQGYTSLPNADL